MINYRSEKQPTLAGFETPFEVGLDPSNRWVKLGQIIPWDGLAEVYYQGLSAKQGRPSKDARLVIGAVIIKHKLCLSDEETVRQIQENPYLQYFVGFPGYQLTQPFAPSLFVEIRRRMGKDVFEGFHQAILERLNTVDEKRTKRKKGSDSDDAQPPKGGHAPQNSDCQHNESVPQETVLEEREGKLILDATVAEQAIRFPTDLGLLNEAREISEKIIDEIYPHVSVLLKKPRTYRKEARKRYLAVVKQRRPRAKVLRRGIKEQLQYLRRNFKHIERLLDLLPDKQIPLPHYWLRKYYVIQHVFSQQEGMYKQKQHRCDDRIVSISQPHVRPIVRGKANKAAEFGSKLSVSLKGTGIASVDEIRWDAYHEGKDLIEQVELYRQRYGVYPEVVLGDPVYGTRENRFYLKNRGIRFGGKPLGRRKKQTECNKEELKRDALQRRQDYRERIPIEGKFGQGKSGYGLNRILAKTARTSEAWINSIFLVMNLLILLQIFIYLIKSVFHTVIMMSQAITRWLSFALRRQSRTVSIPNRSFGVTF
jgi:IS5 family transposase